MQKFWNWKNKNEASEDRTLVIDGDIASESWFDDDVTPKIFKDELFSASGPVTIWINSPGGDCIAASQIYSMLMDYKGTITIKIDGLAASAASVVAMAGSKVLMAPTAIMMIHNPATTVSGDHNDMEKGIDILNEVKESIINAYEIKTGQSRTVLSHLMEAETWMNAKKAIELGFADGLLTGDVRPETENCAYAFSTREVESHLLNKIASKQKETAEPKKDGRVVDELKKELNKIKKYI